MAFDPFQRRRLGRTDVMCTAMGLGGAPMGERQMRVANDVADAIVRRAYDAGIRYFDTAPWYGQGKSEHRIGRNLHERPRHEFVLSTKVGRVFKRPEDPLTFNPPWLGGGLKFDFDWDYGRDGVMRSYEDSLLRLGMNRVDALIIHDLDPSYHGAEGVAARFDELDHDGGFRALEDLKASGEIGAIGAGINMLGMMPRFLERFPLDFFLVAMPYTLLDQDVLDVEFPLLEERGVSVVIGSVLASGILATGPGPNARYGYKIAPKPVQRRVRRIQAICARHGVSMVAAALQFPLAHPVVAAIIPGAYEASHVSGNLADLFSDIPAGFWAELKAEKLLHQAAPTPA